MADRPSHTYRYLTVGFSLLIGGGMSVLASVMAWNLEVNGIKNNFEQKSQDFALHLQQHLNEYSQVTQTITTFYQTSGEVTQQNFPGLSRAFLATHQGILGIAWVRRLDNSQRNAYEKTMKVSGNPDFRIFKLENSENPQIVSQNPEYFPLIMGEPQNLYQPLIGFDLGTNPELRLPLEQARDSGQITVSGRINLVEGGVGFTLNSPVYRRGSLPTSQPERRQAFVGIIYSAYNFTNIVQETLKELNQFNLDFYVFDTSTDSHSPLVFFEAKTQQIIDNPDALTRLQQKENRFPLPSTCQSYFTCRYPLKIGTQEWFLVVKPNSEFMGIPWITYSTLGIGLIVTAFFAFYSWWSWDGVMGIAKLEQKHKAELTQINRAKEELEIRVRQRNTQLKVANQRKNELLANITHKFRIPLNIILGFIQLLNRGSNLTLEQRSDLETITRSSEYLLALFNDVLEMSRLEAGNSTLNVTCFKLRSLLMSVKNMLSLKAKEKNLQLTLFIATNIPEWIELDEDKLRQVLINLLDNAIKFTSEGGVTLRVDGTNKEGEINPNSTSTPENAYNLLFEIEDTGVGIAPEELGRVFEPFQQSEQESYTNQGTGLGLFISQKLVQLMGGKITVSSTLEQGTLFQVNLPINLPIKEEMLNPQLIRQVVALAPHQQEYRILLVDGKVENRRLLTRLLVPLGFKIREASNGSELIEIWLDWQPHLIFMDTRMLIMDGEKAIQKIKAQSKQHQTVIIAITSRTLEFNRGDSLILLCDDVLYKPFSLELLLDKIATHLGVHYLYEDNEISNQGEKFDPSSSLILHAASFEVMPPEWIAEVYYAASAGHSQRLYELLEQIPKKHSTLANAIAELVYHFNFRKLRELTKPREN